MQVLASQGGCAPSQKRRMHGMHTIPCMWRKPLKNRQLEMMD